MDLDNILKLNNEIKKEHGDTKVESWANENQSTWMDSKTFNNISKMLKENNEYIDEESTIQMAIIFKKIGSNMNRCVDDKQVQKYIEQLKELLENKIYGKFSKEKFEEILRLYVNDEKNNALIDTVGGKGCAQYLAKAIKYYCQH